MQRNPGYNSVMFRCLNFLLVRSIALCSNDEPWSSNIKALVPIPSSGISLVSSASGTSVAASGCGILKRKIVWVLGIAGSPQQLF